MPGPSRRGAVLNLIRDILAFGGRRLGGARVLLPVLLILFGGAWLFARLQHVPYFTAIYWAITTASTVGYGDVAPVGVPARLVAIGMMVLAVPLLGLGLAEIASQFVEGRLRSMLGMARASFPHGYTLVLGWSASARVAVGDLLQRGHTVVVVADDDSLGQEHVRLHFVHGDPADEHLIGTVHPERARACLLCHTHDGDMLVASVALHRMAPDLALIAVPTRAGTMRAMRELGVGVAFPAAEFIGYVLARGSETPHAGLVLWQLVADDDVAIRELAPGAEEVGRTLAAVTASRAARGEFVLGLLRGGEVRLAAPDQVIAAADRLLAFRRT